MQPECEKLVAMWSRLNKNREHMKRHCEIRCAEGLISIAARNGMIFPQWLKYKVVEEYYGYEDQ